MSQPAQQPTIQAHMPQGSNAQARHFDRKKPKQKDNEKPILSVVGLGYVGAVTSVCFSNLGFKVIGVDSNAQNVAAINSGGSPIIEEGLKEGLYEGINNHTFYATTDLSEAVLKSSITLVCVGTPSDEDGACDLTHIKQVSKQIGIIIADKESYHTIVFKSTVPPGTTENILQPIIEKYSNKIAGSDFGLCFYPEFLRESTAISDFFHPANSIIGTMDKHSAAIVNDLIKEIDADIYLTSIAVSEFVKYVDNTWHATKVCFANEIGRLCKKLNVDSHEVMNLFVKDTKLNISASYLKPGFAYGGSCLPKDIRGMKSLAKSLNIKVPLIEGVIESNQAHIDQVVTMVKESGCKEIGICGLTFKIGTNDMRESPNEILLLRLIEAGLNVTFFDPLVSAKHKFYVNEEMNASVHKTRSSHIQDFMNKSQLIILAHDDEYSNLAIQISEGHHKIIDLVRIRPIENCKAQIQGVCW
ncbi:MAG: nucleotide sugar dehydrogenase [Bermanella sp.]